MYNNVNLARFLRWDSNGHCRSVNMNEILSWMFLLQGFLRTKRAALCWIISILLISHWWYGSHIDAQYSKTGVMNFFFNLTLKNISWSFEDFFSGILIIYLPCYKHSLICVGTCTEINNDPAYHPNTCAVLLLLVLDLVL